MTEEVGATEGVLSLPPLLCPSVYLQPHTVLASAVWSIWTLLGSRVLMRKLRLRET
jgi:hypothetical protein